MIPTSSSSLEEIVRTQSSAKLYKQLVLNSKTLSVTLGRENTISETICGGELVGICGSEHHTPSFITNILDEYLQNFQGGLIIHFSTSPTPITSSRRVNNVSSNVAAEYKYVHVNSLLHAIAALQLLEDSLPRAGLGSGSNPPALVIFEKFSTLLLAQQTPYSLQSMSKTIATTSSTTNIAYTSSLMNTTTCMEIDLFAHITHVAESKLAFTIWIQAETIGGSSGMINSTNNTAKQNQNTLVSAIKKRMQRLIQIPN